MAVDPATESRDLFELHWLKVRVLQKLKQEKENRKIICFWLALVALIPVREENFSSRERGNGYFQFPVTPSSHTLIHILISLLRLTVSSLLSLYSSFPF